VWLGGMFGLLCRDFGFLYFIGTMAFSGFGLLCRHTASNSITTETHQFFFNQTTTIINFLTDNHIGIL